MEIKITPNIDFKELIELREKDEEAYRKRLETIKAVIQDVAKIFKEKHNVKAGAEPVEWGTRDPKLAH